MDPLDPALFAVSTCRPCCAPALDCLCYLVVPNYVFDVGSPPEYYCAFRDVPPGTDPPTPAIPAYDNMKAFMDAWAMECCAIVRAEPTSSRYFTKGTDSFVAGHTTGFSENNYGYMDAVAVLRLKAGTATISWHLEFVFINAPLFPNTNVSIQLSPYVPGVCTPQNTICSTDGAQFGVNIVNEPGTSITGSDTFTVPVDGVYFFTARLYGLVSGGDGSSSSAASVGISNPTGLSYTPVVATWEEAGTNRPYEQCPKMLLPPRTESSGDWYVDATAAQDALDELASNCIGFIASLHPLGKVYAFDADFSGGALTLETTNTDPAGDPGIIGAVMYASVIAMGGETFTFTIHGTGAFLESGYIFDYTGTVVQNLPIFGDGSFATSAPLPYRGRYFFEFTMSGAGDVGSPSVSVVVTSSAAMTVNPIQALYDDGFPCPARLDCVP